MDKKWLWVKPGEGGGAGAGAGAGVGDQWIKSGDWELGDHVIEFCCFNSTLKWVKVCLKHR